MRLGWSLWLVLVPAFALCAAQASGCVPMPDENSAAGSAADAAIPSGPSGDLGDLGDLGDAGTSSDGREGMDPELVADAGDSSDGPAGEVRSIFAAELINARDVGGTALPQGAQVSYGRLFRGPPLAFSSEGCAEFERLGIRSVIDLRISEERDAVPEAPCIELTAEVIEAPLPVPYQVSASDYITVLHTRDSVAAAFAVLGDASAYPVYVHCTYGRDRTGVLIALVLRALGASREEILREYSLSRASVGATPSSLVAALDELEAQGGVEAFLASSGVNAEQLSTLRDQVIARSPSAP